MQISKYDYQLFTLMKPAVFTWCLIHVLRKASLKEEILPKPTSLLICVTVRSVALK